MKLNLLTSLLRTKQNAFIWLINFLTFNILLFWLLGLPYFSFLIVQPTLTANFPIWLFFVFAYLGQLALLVLLFVGSINFIGILFLKRRILILLSAIIASFLVMTLFIDLYLFKYYHFHVNGVVLQFLFDGGLIEIIEPSRQEELIFFLTLVGLFFIELGISWFCWRINKIHHWGYFYIIAPLPIALLFLSYSIFALSTENALQNKYHMISAQAPILPLYNNFLALLLPAQTLEDTFRAGEDIFMQPTQITRPLNYPHKPLIFSSPTTLPNIVIIGLDAWRFDMMNAEVTPHIHQFSKRCMQFQKHYSGGNATQPGLFSLFYSIPGTYWSSALAQGQGPLLISELNKLQYNVRIFNSAPSYNPPFDKTLFKDVVGLPRSTPGKLPDQRDANITQAFHQFLKTRDPAKPFFSFIFYDTSHGYCLPGSYPQIFLPSMKNCNRLILSERSDPLPLKNRYKNALHYVDTLVGQVLADLEQQNLLNNTIVILLSDHGEEFNENGLNYWGHASNYTDFQIHTPLLIYWPNKQPRLISYQTSHFDIVPTLFKHAFNCQNPASDYSVGSDLFNPSTKSYLVIGSYIDFGIVEEGSIMRILPGGNLEVLDSHNRPTALRPSMNNTKLAFAEIQRFYQSHTSQ